MGGGSIHQAKMIVSIWHCFVAVVCIILGIASCVRSAAFMHTEGNPGNLYSLNGYVAAGIWSGASFLIIGIATCSLLETQPDKVFWRSILNVTGILIAGALFAISLYSAFYNDLRCPFDQYTEGERSQANVYEEITTNPTTISYKFNTVCKHRNVLVGLDATMMVIGLVEVMTMTASLLMDVSCCSWNCFGWESEDVGHNDYFSRYRWLQVMLSIVSLFLGVTCTDQQAKAKYVSPDFWSLNGFIGTGIWSGAYQILLIFITLPSLPRAEPNIPLPELLLSIFLSAVGVIDLVAVIVLSIFSGFVTNRPCTLEEYQQNVICTGRNLLAGLDLSLMVLGIIQAILLTLVICTMCESLKSTSENRSMMNIRSLVKKFRRAVQRLEERLKETTVSGSQSEEKITSDGKLSIYSIGEC